MSDRIAVLAAGRLVQVGTPAELYCRPRTPFVARFLGEANLLDATTLGLGRSGLVLVRPEECGSAAWTKPRLVAQSAARRRRPFPAPTYWSRLRSIAG
ncbi:MAG: hypothetical protein U0736_20900 [Gemmataceae bacterium]